MLQIGNKTHWKLQRINFTTSCRKVPFAGSNATAHIRFPPFLKSSAALINGRRNDLIINIHKLPVTKQVAAACTVVGHSHVSAR